MGYEHNILHNAADSSTHLLKDIIPKYCGEVYLSNTATLA